MSSEAREMRQNAHTWVDKLSDEQVTAVAPLLQALTGLLTACGTGASAPNEIRDIPRPVVLSAGAADTLEGRLEKALEVSDAEELQNAIASCLELVRAEKNRLSETALLQPESRTDRRSPFKSLTIATSDMITGLPARSIFERSVMEAFTENKESVVALFVIDRLAYINKRFGRATGDEILLYVAQYLARELPDSSALARWSGPAFATLVDSASAAKRTEMQVRAIASKRLSKTIDTGGRTAVMIPISCSCVVECLGSENSPETIFSRLDEFLLAHLTEP